MGKWAGKFVIGLTGNIGTGKSVVRKMLEHLGAYGIDADALGHRAIAKGSPGYAPIVDLFGKWVVGPDGQIDRVRLGKIVFNDPAALAALEQIVHPLVWQAVDFIIQRSTQPVIVIEAIKLLESNVAKYCDSVWVAAASPEIQLARLMSKRGLTEADGRTRILAQPAQEKKIAAAHVVIRNEKTFEDTWRQVVTSWRKVVPASFAAEPAEPQPVAQTISGELSVARARPRNSVEIASLLTRLRGSGKPVTADDVMAMFGEKAFMVLYAGNTMVGIIGWQVENLVARTTDILVDPKVAAAEALPALVNEMERASRELQSEASLIFAPSSLSKQQALWEQLGYAPREPKSLDVFAWQEAAQESSQPGAVLFFKKLRQDRILRPI